MEIQITDFENAAFTVFIALVSRAILLFGLNLYIPISQVRTIVPFSHLHRLMKTCRELTKEMPS